MEIVAQNNSTHTNLYLAYVNGWMYQILGDDTPLHVHRVTMASEASLISFIWFPIETKDKNRKLEAFNTQGIAQQIFNPEFNRQSP